MTGERESSADWEEFRGADYVVTVRTVTFTLREMRSHWRAPNREVTRSDLHFSRSTLAAELGRACWGVKVRGRERRKRIVWRKFEAVDIKWRLSKQVGL